MFLVVGCGVADDPMGHSERGEREAKSLYISEKMILNRPARDSLSEVIEKTVN